MSNDARFATCDGVFTLFQDLPQCFFSAVILYQQASIDITEIDQYTLYGLFASFAGVFLQAGRSYGEMGATQAGFHTVPTSSAEATKREMELSDKA